MRYTKGEKLASVGGRFDDGYLELGSIEDLYIEDVLLKPWYPQVNFCGWASKAESDHDVVYGAVWRVKVVNVI